MVLKVEIVDGRGGGQKARTTSRGELVVNRFDYSEAYAVTASVVDTAYNFVPPVAGKRFVITDVLIYADKGVLSSDANVQIYEADGVDELTVSKNILNTDIPKQTARDLTGLNLIITAGKWVNIKTNDNTVYATLMGYYVTE